MGGSDNGSGGRGDERIGVISPVNHPFIFIFSSFSILFIFFKIPTFKCFAKVENGEITTSNPLLSFYPIDISMVSGPRPFFTRQI